MAAWWMALLTAAVLVTTARKVASIGWGIGWAELKLIGISGDAMFAAAVYPLLLGTLAFSVPRRTGRLLAVAAGSTLPPFVGVSRVVVGAHSVSEVSAGLLVGGMASAVALALVRLPCALIGPAIPAVVGVWLVLMPAHAPSSQTHSMVTRLSLMLSRHKTPYRHSDMLRELRRRQSAPCEPPACTRTASMPFEA
jgi:hypothetical protein